MAEQPCTMRADMLRTRSAVSHAWNVVGDILFRQQQPDLAHQVRLFTDQFSSAMTEKETIAAGLVEQVRKKPGRDRGPPVRT